MVRPNSNKYLAQAFKTPPEPEEFDLHETVEALSHGLRGALAKDVFEDLGVELPQLPGKKPVFFQREGDVRRQGYLIHREGKGDGEIVTVELDDRTRIQLKAYQVEDLDVSDQEREAELKSALVWTNERTDVEIRGAPTKIGHSEYAVDLRYSAVHGMPSEALVLKAIKRHLESDDVQLLDAESVHPGHLSAVIRPKTAAPARTREPSAATASVPERERVSPDESGSGRYLRPDGLEVEDAVLRSENRAVLKVKWDRASADEISDRNLTHAIEGFVRAYLGRNRREVGSKGRGRMRIDIDRSRGRAICVVPVYGSHLPEQVLIARD